MMSKHISIERAIEILKRVFVHLTPGIKVSYARKRLSLRAEGHLICYYMHLGDGNWVSGILQDMDTRDMVFDAIMSVGTHTLSTWR